MKGSRPLATACAFVVLLGATAFAYASIVGTPELQQTAKRSKGLSVSGHVRELQPGVPATLSTRVKNNLSREVRVRSLRVRVGDASPACPRTLLTVKRQQTKKKALSSRKIHTIPLTVTLSASVPDACQDAKFPLRFTVRAKGI